MMPALATLQYSPDGSLIAVGELTNTTEEPLLLRWLSEHFYAIPMKERQRVVRLWDAEAGREHAGLYDSTSVVFSPTSKTLAAERSDGEIELWDVPISTSLNSWWTITAAAVAATVVSLAALLVLARRLSRRTGRAEPASRAT
jgi:hypothetical protein